MSLDVLKNALYQAVTTSIAGLVFYPEVIDFAREAFPSLGFQEVDSARMGARTLEEYVNLPTSYLAAPATPVLTVGTAGSLATAAAGVDVAVTWSNAQGETTGSTVATSGAITGPDGSVSVEQPAAPVGATGWSVYAGAHGGTLYQAVTGLAVGAGPYVLATLPAAGVTVPAANTAGTAFQLYRVIERFRTKLALLLRDSLGTGPKDAAAYQKVRDQFNALDRFFARTEAVTIGAAGAAQTFAELWYQGNRATYDAKSGVYQHLIEVDVEWRLLDEPSAAVATYAANTITVDVVNEPDGTIRIARVYTS